MDVLHLVLGVVQGGLRSLLLFSLGFALIQSLILLPLLAMSGRLLTGKPVVDSTELVRFAGSPRGVITIVLAGAAIGTLYLMEQAGLTTIAVGQLHGVQVSSTDALWFVASNLRDLLMLALAAMWRILLIILPLLLVTALVAWRLLRKRDINYYLDLLPARFVFPAAILACLALITGGVLLYKLVHWRLAVPILTLEGVPAREALQRSAVVSHPVWTRLLLYAGIILGVGALLNSAVTWSVRSLGLLALGSRSGVLGLVIVAVVGMLAIALHALVATTVSITDATLFATAWDGLGKMSPSALVPLLEQVARPPDYLALDRSSMLVFGSAIALLGLGAFNTWRIGAVLSQQRPTTVTAHRGSPRGAPENSLSAIRLAIAEGADFVEIDVQETKDGAVVLVHDADLARMAGLEGRISNMTLDEVKAADIGARTGPEHAGERVPTLDEVLVEVQDKARLLVELKYHEGEQQLAARVVAAIRARGMTEQVVVQSLTYRGLEEVRRLAPRIRIGYVIAAPMGKPHRLDVDFYAVNQRFLDPAFVAQAHRRGRRVAAWTVNDPGDMVSLAGMGVDSIITDVPADAQKALADHWEKDPVELRLQRLRAWLGA